jgi:hypothetical protein
MRVLRFIKKFVWWGVTLALVFVCLFAVFPRLPYGEAKEKRKNPQVIVVYNVDTFEGGKGARGAFLGRLATEFEKRHDDVLCMVSTKTIEGLKETLKKGDIPDLISFGVGAGFVGEYCREEVKAWYRGGYALYTRREDFSLVSAKNCVISKGGENLPLVAAALSGLQGDFDVEDSTTAYVRFLNEEYEYLLGTQRDACRFLSRGVTVRCQPIEGYNDLFGYIGISTISPEKVRLCEEFVSYVLSKEKQSELVRLGLFSPYYSIYGQGEDVFGMLEGVKATYTLHSFTSTQTLVEISSAAEQVLQGKNVKELKKFLKFL